MTEEKIMQIYQKMGLGTQEERNKLLRWAPSAQRPDENIQTFIIETPNTNSNEEAQNAELARDSE
jgi:hypothetical protein